MTQTPPSPVEQVSPPPSQPVEPDKEARTWGMFCHLFALGGYVIPLGWIIGPLFAWLVKKDQYPFVNDQGKESLNWQLTLLIGFIISIPLCFICVGLVLLPALGVLDLIFVIIASMKANEGIAYRYPYSIKFIK